MKLKKLLPGAAVTIFAVMVAVGEFQVCSSPKWPPPARHELGAWTIESPPILDWAASLNAPASILIGLAWSRSDAFAYLADDHNWVIYLPYTLLVLCQWWFVACRLDGFITGRVWKSKAQRNVDIVGQAFVTAEMIFAAEMLSGAPRATGRLTVYIVGFAIWSLLAVLGWADLVLNRLRPATSAQTTP